jgi:hypothetical protein
MMAPPFGRYISEGRFLPPGDLRQTRRVECNRAMLISASDSSRVENSRNLVRGRLGVAAITSHLRNRPLVT